MLRLILSFLLAVVAGIHLLPAQDLHIYYDAFRDSVHYTHRGKTIDRPAVRKGNSVVVHVYNFNDFIYDVQVKTPQAASATRSGGINLGTLLSNNQLNPFKLIFGAGNPLGGISGIAGLLKNFGIGSKDDEGPSSGFAAPPKENAPLSDAERKWRALSEEMELHGAELQKAVQSLEGRDREITALHKEIQALMKTAHAQSVTVEEIKRLRYDPELEPQRIKRLAQDHMRSLFDETDPGKLSLAQMQELTDLGEEMYSLRQQYERRVARYADDTRAVQLAGGALADTRFDFPGSNVQKFRIEAARIAETAVTNLEAYQGNIKVMTTGLSEIRFLDADALNALRKEYIVLMERDFSRIIRRNASSDNLDIQLVFTPLDSIQIKGTASRTTAPIEVRVYGGLQVSAGLGLSFSQFFDRPQTFFVRDSVIQGSEQGAFTPLITSFVHFYPQSRGELSFGGSCGVGIPFAGSGAGLDGITFFLGPGMVLGRTQRIVISAGLTGGKVGRLAGGYAVGDRFEAPSDLLKTESIYRLGYSVGVSFNVLGGK